MRFPRNAVKRSFSNVNRPESTSSPPPSDREVVWPKAISAACLLAASSPQLALIVAHTNFLFATNSKKKYKRRHKNGVDPDGNQSWGEWISSIIYDNNTLQATCPGGSELTCGLCLCRFRCWTWWVAGVKPGPRNGDTSVTLTIYFNCSFNCKVS